MTATPVRTEDLGRQHIGERVRIVYPARARGPETSVEAVLTSVRHWDAATNVSVRLGSESLDLDLNQSTPPSEYDAQVYLLPEE